MRRHWLFIAAAALPCAVLALFCAYTIHEWWLISSHQIAVIPAPRPGDTSLPEVPASRLLPFVFGSGVLAALFAFALLRNSMRALVAGYAGLLLVVGQAVVRHL